jgi:hypothetical protein
MSGMVWLVKGLSADGRIKPSGIGCWKFEIETWGEHPMAAERFRGYYMANEHQAENGIDVR